jgi:hypothetical protein
MSNPFVNVGNPNQSGIVYDMFPVVPNNSSDNVGTNNVAIGVYIETGGAVSFQNYEGTVRTVNVPDNFYLITSVKRVLSTNTTATGIHALVV